MLPDETIKKAYALAYAAFRLGSTLNNSAIRQRLEGQGFELLACSLEENGADFKKAVVALEYMIALGRDTGLIHPQSAEIVLAEIDTLKASIQEKAPLGLSPVQDIFPKEEEADFAEVLDTKEPGKEVAVSIADSGNSAIPMLDGVPALTRQNGDATGRQESILELIRQFGNCRMKDIQEALPNVSERTLRYDLQRLVIEGLLERAGNGGPATYYKLKPEL